MEPSRKSGVVAIIQARMGSSRLPGKVLKDIGGEPMLSRVVARARRARTVEQVVVATTTDAGDDALAAFCQAQGFPCYRGHPHDVLDRYYQAAQAFDAEVVVRLTADCPLIDPREIDRTVRAFQAAEVDFAANRLPPPWQRTTPIGMDTEVVTFDALAQAWGEAEADHAREHVMPYFYEQPDRFKILLVDHEPDWGQFRLTVDTAEDLALVREVVRRFDNTDEFSLEDVIQLLSDEPDLLSLNADVHPKFYDEIDRRS